MVLDFLPALAPTSPQGSIGRLALDQLRPTQNAVGRDEVKAKADKIKKMDEARLRDYLLERTVPVVIGNAEGADEKHPTCFYLLDHHHLTAALWEALDDPKAEVFAEVRRNWAPLAGRRCWKSLVSNNWVYPYDGMGAGPLNPDLLKTSVGSLENDLYRSLAWVIRLKYGFVKDPENPTFAEFRWASFFRGRVLFDAQLTCTKDCMNLTLADIEKQDPDDYADKIEFARYLAQSPEAAGLPGFRG